MNHLNRNSLGSILDAISESLFFKQTLPKAQRLVVARWLVTRQGLPGSYTNTFAPPEKDTVGIRRFTGERVRTQAGLAHLLGEK
jgi:hypothetical protein